MDVFKKWKDESSSKRAKALSLVLNLRDINTELLVNEILPFLTAREFVSLCSVSKFFNAICKVEKRKEEDEDDDDEEPKSLLWTIICEADLYPKEFDTKEEYFKYVFGALEHRRYFLLFNIDFTSDFLTNNEIIDKEDIYELYSGLNYHSQNDNSFEVEGKIEIGIRNQKIIDKGGYIFCVQKKYSKYQEDFTLSDFIILDIGNFKLNYEDNGNIIDDTLFNVGKLQVLFNKSEDSLFIERLIVDPEIIQKQKDIIFESYVDPERRKMLFLDYKFVTELGIYLKEKHIKMNFKPFSRIEAFKYLILYKEDENEKYMLFDKENEIPYCFHTFNLEEITSHLEDSSKYHKKTCPKCDL